MLKNCYSASTVNSNGEQFSSGLVGYVSNLSIIENCYNYGEVVGNHEAGGIVGGLQGTIMNSYNAGVVTGLTTSGVIAGQYYTDNDVNPTIINCYNSSSVTGGGIIGKIVYNGVYSLKNNYYLKGSASYGIYSKKSDEGASPLSQDEMPSVLSVINRDNAFVEDTNNINNGYPILKWQAERENN